MGYYNWADRQLRDLMAKNPTYKRSQYPGMQLGLAGGLLNSRMPGASQYGQNILTSQAGVLGQIDQTATDASQALAAKVATQGQTDKSFGDLQLMEMDWKKYALNNLNDAYAANANEDRYENEMVQQKYANEVQLRGAQAANKLAKRKALWNTVGQVANLGVSLFTGGIGGGGGTASGGGVGSALGSMVGGTGG